MSLRALLYRRPTEPSALEIIFDKSVFLVRLRRHRQARRYTLRIDAPLREVVLTMPPRGSVREARDFAQQHGGWIAARLKRLPEAAPFVHGVEVPLRGIPHRIVHRRGVRGTVWTETDDRGQRLMCVAGEPPHLDRRGSCSNTGVLSFSWRLILAPSFALDYLAAHEVAHLKELNHSPRFWRLVGRLDADFERAKAWLDAHGTDLHRYGLAPKARPGRRADGAVTR
jgi:predicted metal-dependent hydrolase